MNPSDPGNDGKPARESARGDVTIAPPGTIPPSPAAVDAAAVVAKGAYTAPKTVVGIGASAGGLEALGALISQFTVDDSAFVVVQHLSPDHDSMLAAGTLMPVPHLGHLVFLPANSSLAVREKEPIAG